MSEIDRIPITVGVVGHLDVVTTSEHRFQIINLFKELAAKYPESPITLFSSLAEGADRFVAELFLELKRCNKEFSERFSLVVPTPLSTVEYEKDFDDASKREFYQLLKQADKHFSVGSTDPGNERALQYLKAGKFVADSSIILIALWDGEKGKKGGTADIVRHKIAGDDDNVAESTFEYDGTVFVMPCSRTGTPASRSAFERAAEPLNLEIVLKDPAIKDVLEKIEEINTELSKIDQREFQKSTCQLIGCNEKLDQSQSLILEWYAVFDILSLNYRKKDIHISLWLFLIGFLLIVTLEVYSNLIFSNLVLGLLMFFNVVATLIYFYSKATGNHKKYLYYRTLAEALRIQFYWNIAAINKNVSDFILKIHRKDFTWVKHLLSSIYGETYNVNTITSETIRDITSGWIKNQADFFKSSIRKITKQLGFYHRISNIAFIAAFALLISIFFLGDFYKRNSYLNDLMVLVGTLLSLFALIRAYTKLKGYEQLLNQYELMSVIYQRAESKIIETDTYNLNPDQKNLYLKELFFVVGKEALIENGNWYLIFKEKEPEIEGI